MSEASTADRRLPKLALVAVLLLAGLASLVPGVDAASTVGTFTIQVIGGSGENHAYVTADGHSGKIGVAFQRSTSQDTGFAIGNFTTGFVVKTNDIDPAQATIKQPYVVKVSDTTWFIAATEGIGGTKQFLYKTTDGGTTWTQASLISGAVSCYSPPTLAYVAVSNMLLWNTCRTTSFGTNLLYSTNLGASFNTARSDAKSNTNAEIDAVYAGGTAGNSAILSGPGVVEYWTAVGLSGSGPSRNVVYQTASADGSYWSNANQRDAGGACGSSCTSNIQMAIRGEYPYSAIAYNVCAATNCPTQTGRYSNNGGVTWGSIASINGPAATDASQDGYAYASGTQLLYAGTAASTPTSVLTLPTTNGAHSVVISGGRLYFFYADQGNGGQLRAQSAPIAYGVAAAAPYASRELTAEKIKGADIDWDGRVLTLRTQTSGGSGVQQIRSLSTGDGALSDKGTPYVLGCNAYHGSGTEREEGVFGYYDRQNGAEFTSFIDCTDTSNRDKGNTWRIRTGTLTHPDLGATSVCEEGDFCDDDVTSSSDTGCPAGNADLPDQTREFSDIQSVPVSFSRGQTQGVAANHATVGFAFFDKSTGEIGVWAKTFNNNGADYECKATVSFSAPNQLYQLCTWTDGVDGTNTGNDYMAAVSNVALTKVLRIEVQPTSTGEVIHALHRPQITLTNVQAPSVPWDHASAIACGGGLDGVIMASNGHVNRLHLVGSQLGRAMWATDYVAPTVTQRGVAFANSGYLAAVYNGVSANTVTVLNGTTGATLSTIVLPTHTQFVGMQLDDTAQHLFVELNTATDGLVREYDVHTLHHAGASIPPGTRQGTGNTTICLDNDGHATNCNGTGTGSSGGGGAGASSTGFSALTTDNQFINIFLGMLLVFGVVWTGIRVGAGGAAIGVLAAIGLFMGYAIGYIPLWIPLVITVAAVAALWFLPRGQGSGV